MYTNPIIYADYSDPDPVRVGDDFYMVASSFTYLPGVPILHSKDLVHWELINYAVKSLPFDKYKVPSHGSGTWAPSIRYHNGEFFIFIPLVDEGIMVARSKDIRGEFKLNMLTHTKGWIDPCPLWDDDGRTYMVFAFAGSRAGIKNRLALIEIDAECTKTIGDYSVIFRGELIADTCEGPKAYKRNGYYYILFPAGGVKPGWQACIRAKDIHGPYEYKPVMHQGPTSITGPHQGGWVSAPDGSDWFLHFQDVYELGRIIHLQPMRFTEEDWPVIGFDKNGDGIGEPVYEWPEPVKDGPHYSLEVSDEFDSDKLSLQWQWQANPDESNYSLAERKGYLRMYPWKNDKRDNLLWYAPNALTEIPQSDSFIAGSYLELNGKKDGDFAAIGMIGHRYGYIGLYYEKGEYSIRVYSGHVTAITYEGEAEEELLYSERIDTDEVYLRIDLRKDKNYFLSYSLDGVTYKTINHIFTLEAATWTGAKLMMWCANKENNDSDGYADFDYFRVN